MCPKTDDQEFNIRIIPAGGQAVIASVCTACGGVINTVIHHSPIWTADE